jgi:hypothetical protein
VIGKFGLGYKLSSCRSDFKIQRLEKWTACLFPGIERLFLKVNSSFLLGCWRTGTESEICYDSCLQFEIAASRGRSRTDSAGDLAVVMDGASCLQSSGIHTSSGAP